MNSHDFQMLSEAYQTVYEEPQSGDYEAIVQYLASEGLVESYDEADELIEQMSDDEILGLLEVTGRGYIEPVTGRHTTSSSAPAARNQKPGSPAMGLMGKSPYEKNRQKVKRVEALRDTPENQKRLRNLEKGGRVMLARHNASRQAAHAARHDEFKKWTASESYDAYDLVLGHLLDEGYADNVQDAEVIMSNMSESWIEGILESASNTIMSVSGSGRTKYVRSPNLTRITDALARLKQTDKEKRKKRAASEYDAATLRGIYRATHRSERGGFEPGEWIKNEPNTNRNARRRRASGR